MSVMHSWRSGLCLALALAVSGCSYPTRNQPATLISETSGYRWGNLEPNALKDTLVIVTASGGGTRATALTLSVLQGLDNLELPDGKSLVEEVDIISSVSGGSVAAAYFALEGKEGFKTLKKKFVEEDGMKAILTAGLNPFGLASLATHKKERIDLLIDYLKDQLFDGASYQTLLDKKQRPFLVLNAADMVESVPFSFTQRKFDLLCSDLSKMPLATAVAASAAFPVALSPVTLKNYQFCDAAKIKNDWPPHWVMASIDKPDDPYREGPSLWYDNPARTSLARAEYAYAVGDEASPERKKDFVHLLDGGIADNLGIFEPYRMLTTRDSQPSFLSEISTGDITKLVFVVINARSFSTSDLDRSRATPGMIDMLLASISTPIDTATAGTASQLRTLLRDEFRQIKLGDPVAEQRFRDLAANTALISIDFDAIPDEECRGKLQGIPTSWTLEGEEIDAVMKIGDSLLVNDPEFSELLRITSASQKTQTPSLEQSCAEIERLEF